MSAGHTRQRTRRKLAALRSEIAHAQAQLAALNAAIAESQSDAGIAIVRSVRLENQRLLAKEALATEAASASQAALDAAVNASQTDPLTGLRNRLVLWDRLSHALELAGRLKECVGVMLLDLDDFKKLNDQFGHALGDLVLQRVASVLTATVRASDTVCRLGGDEFVILASTTGRDGVDQLAAKIKEALAEPMEIGGLPLRLSVSLGASVFPDDGDAAAALIEKADQAMYRAKRARAPTPRG